MYADLVWTEMFPPSKYKKYHHTSGFKREHHRSRQNCNHMNHGGGEHGAGGAHTFHLATVKVGLKL